jgi:hypothetical protein
LAQWLGYAVFLKGNDETNLFERTNDGNARPQHPRV